MRAALPLLGSLSGTVHRLVDPKVLNTSLLAISKLLITLGLGVVAAYRGLLDTATLRALSKVVYNLFLPALLFTNIVQTLSLPRAPGLFLLPLAAVAQVALGLLVGMLGARALGLRRGLESRIYLVCSAFGNSAALPLLFASALFASTPAFPSLVSGLSFFLLGWTGLFWSLGYSLLTTAAEDAEADVNDKNNLKKKKKSFDIALLLKRILTPPLVASLLGLLIGLFTPVRTVLVPSPLFAALKTLASGYGPTAVLILAGSLRPKPKTADDDNNDKRPQISSNKKDLRISRMVFGISATRFMLMPIIAFLMVKYGPFKSQFIALAVLLESVMPSAQNSTLILNLEGQSEAASKVASILLAVYLVGVIPISVALTLFLEYTGTAL